MKKILSFLLIALAFDLTCMSYESYMAYHDQPLHIQQRQTRKQYTTIPRHTIQKQPIQRSIIEPTTEALNTTSIQPAQSTSIGQFSLDITYKNPKSFAFSPTKTISLPLTGTFTTQDLINGLTLHVSLFPPSTSTTTTDDFGESQQQGYLIVAMLVSPSGNMVARTNQNIMTPTPPTNMLLKYNGLQVSPTKQFFTSNTQLTTEQNQSFFNKKAPIHKKIFIKQTKQGLAAQ